MSGGRDIKPPFVFDPVPGRAPDLLVNPDGTVRLAEGYEEIRRRILRRLARPPLWARGLASWLRRWSGATSITADQIMAGRLEWPAMAAQIKRLDATPRA